MILVYHAKKPTFGLTRKIWPDDYELVARVDVNNPEEAYYLTQHLNFEWWKNKGVDLVKKSRSTSVGDVLIDVNTGDILLVENIGLSVIGRINPYTPRYIERPYKVALKLFDALKRFRATGPMFAYHDMIVEKLAYHLDAETKTQVSIPESLIQKAINELENFRAKLPERERSTVTIIIKAYLDFLGLPYTHYREYHKWTEWD